LRTLGAFSDTANLINGVAFISAFTIFSILNLISRRSDVTSIRKQGLYFNLSLALFLIGAYHIFIFLLMGEHINSERAITFFRLAYAFGIPSIPIFLKVVLNLTIGSYRDVLAAPTTRIKELWKSITKLIWYPMWTLTAIVWIANLLDLIFSTKIFFAPRLEPIDGSFIPLTGITGTDILIRGINPVWIIWVIALVLTIAMEIAYMIRSIGFDKAQPDEYEKVTESMVNFFRKFWAGIKDKNPNVKWIKTFSLSGIFALFSVLIQGIIGYDWQYSFPITSYTNTVAFFTVVIVLIGEVVEARESAVTAFTVAYNSNVSSRMLRTVSHEMNQPLFIIGSFFNQLKESYQTKLAHEEKGSLSFRKKEIDELMHELKIQEEQLKRLIRTQSNLGKQAKMFITEIKPSLLNNVIVEEVDEKNYNKKGKIFHIDKSLDTLIQKVDIDEDQMRSILKNLIENAIDALPEKKGKIEVSSKLHGNLVIISIKDNGSGIPKQWKNKVIEPFFTTKRTGTGIGLSIVKNFLDEINGILKIDSDGKSGTTVSISFPVNNIIQKKGE